MKCISLWQPWASLVALGLKRFETRHWSTSYRGPLVIHAAKRWTRDERDSLRRLWNEHDAIAEAFDIEEPPPLGAVVAVARLVACRPMAWEGTPRHVDAVVIENVDKLERDVGGWAAGRFAWQLEDVQLVVPAEVRGRQGLFDLDTAGWQSFDDMMRVRVAWNRVEARRG